MKTNEVKACVTRQLRRLQVLPEPQRRAELAELRRGVGRQPGDLPALWGALLADMPEQLPGRTGPRAACSGGSTRWQRRIPCRKSRTTCAG